MSWRIGPLVLHTSGMSSRFYCIFPQLLAVPLAEGSGAGRETRTSGVARLTAIHALPDSPGKRLGKHTSASQSGYLSGRRARFKYTNIINIYLGLLARPPDLRRRRSNGPADGAKTHSLCSPVGLSVFSQTCMCTCTCTAVHTCMQIQSMRAHTHTQSISM